MESIKLAATYRPIHTVVLIVKYKIKYMCNLLSINKFIFLPKATANCLLFAFKEGSIEVVSIVIL